MKLWLFAPFIAVYLFFAAPAQALNPDSGTQCPTASGAACEKPADNGPKVPSAQPDKAKKNNVECKGDLKKAGLCNANGTKDNSGSSWNPVKKIPEVIADMFTGSAIQMIKWMSTWWINVGSPELDGAGKPVAFVRGTTHWLVGFTVTLGLLIAAGRTAWERRGEPIRQALSGLVTLIIVSACSVLVVDLSLQAGDAFSEAILNASTSGDISTSANILIGGGAPAAVFASPGTAIVLALLILFSGLIQFGMMMLRSVMVVVLAGLLPLAAAASITQDGRAWLRKMMAWLLAYILYKPAAAILYAIAFKWISEGNGLEPLQGILIIIMAVLTLPALLRFIAPMVGPAAGSGSAGAAAAAGLVALGTRAFGGSSAQGRDPGPTGALTTPPASEGNPGQETGRPVPVASPQQPSGTLAPAAPAPATSTPTPTASERAGQSGSFAQNAARGAGSAHPAGAAMEVAARGARVGQQTIDNTLNPATGAEGGPHA